MRENIRCFSSCPETNRRLFRLTGLELESVVVTKRSLDKDYPNHVKEFGPGYLWRYARFKVLEELAEPLIAPDQEPLIEV